jgi:nucleoside-diphosphate-sugar epimerase
VTGLDTLYFDGCTFGAETGSIPALRKDIRDVSQDDLRSIDAVVHLAALCNDPIGDLNSAWTSDINHRASVRLAQLARDAGISRFVYASSCSMYGRASDQAVTESAPMKPLTAYAVSKVKTEEDVAALADRDFSPVFMRNATAYGCSPRFRADVALNNFVCWAHTTGRIRIMSDGTPWRPIVHVEDIAHAFAETLVAPRDTIHNQAFNVGANGENYQVRELAEIVKAVVPGSTIELTGETGPDPRSYRVDFTKLAKAIPSFVPRWTARAGAQQMYDACRDINLTVEQFQGNRYIRLVQLRSLIDAGRLDGDLRWTTTAS